ncbi:MAG: response regulator [Bacteroidetes bacterium]|nr:response regulator [Bacteroidota bacterium]
MNFGNKNILIIVNEAIVALDIKNIFLNEGYNVIGVTSSLNETLEKIGNFKNVNLIIMDSDLSDFHEKLSKAEKVYRIINTPLIIITSHIEFMKSKCENYKFIKLLKKPFGHKDLFNIATSSNVSITN